MQWIFVQSWSMCTTQTCVIVFPQKEVKDVFAAITFEASYSLGKHVLDVRREHELGSLSPVLRWRKGEKLATRNKVR